MNDDKFFLKANAAGCRYNAVQYNMILHTSDVVAVNEAEYKSGFEPTKDNP